MKKRLQIEEKKQEPAVPPVQPTERPANIGRRSEHELYDPDLWTVGTPFLTLPGQVADSIDLFYDYRTNVDCVSKVAGLVATENAAPSFWSLWGKHESFSFDLGEPDRYRPRNVPNSEVYVTGRRQLRCPLIPKQMRLPCWYVIHGRPQK